ncbi:MAG: aldo/keto reductase [Bacteroidota bacterium]
MDNHKFELRKLGNSDLMVSPIGLGCWQFSKGKGIIGGYWQKISSELTKDVVQASLDYGINWFDTAEVYGRGESERSLAEALMLLGVSSQGVLIATKWWPLFRFAGSITETIEERKRLLHPFPISLHQIHQPYTLASIASQMKAMALLVAKHDIRYVGVSNFSAKAMRTAHTELQKYGLKLTSNQVHYNLAHRRIESNGVMETAKELGIGIIAYSPLAQGLLTGRFHDNPDALNTISIMRRRSGRFSPRAIERSRPLISSLQEIGRRYQKTASQVALNWLINFHGATVVAIPGATKVEQAKSNALAMTFTLTTNELSELDIASRQFS